ncbi:protein translocase subunit SecF [Sneathiella sp. HT1-7]|jgi:preprotein translocase SecF subunit|uniref:protein translocase subunit SecF n=1 Tax=Sneathiella sp. HT1-7 TaxID=2887192 RepID=UPI001D145ABE|nr:protein translocase subunit SecF [Sneathiella sp. HT1-7]MCC3305008.1 protein translocase subunit SecF [Sneathiella sp. HT1-7]
MYKIKLVPDNTAIPFLKYRMIAFILSAVLILGSIGAFLTIGFNKGIDFEGGILIEVGTETAPDLGDMRGSLGGLGLGQVALQTFGSDTDILIRVQRQEGDASAQQEAVTVIKQQLASDFGDEISYRRVEFVGPTVSEELVIAATEAVVVAVLAMLVYIWLRFEWHYSVGAVIALVHDVILTIGMFAITRIEFNLASVAAILTIVGYSINDTVVVYDRIRENFRRYKKLSVAELINLSINETLTRTVMTSVTTLLALVALYIFGGEVIRGFATAMIFGVIVGTYSSIFVAAPVLLHIGLTHQKEEEDGFAGAERADGDAEEKS